MERVTNMDHPKTIKIIVGNYKNKEDDELLTIPRIWICVSRPCKDYEQMAL